VSNAAAKPFKLCVLKQKMSEEKGEVRKGSNEVTIEIGKPYEH
jgi:hypothetical protein